MKCAVQSKLFCRTASHMFSKDTSGASCKNSEVTDKHNVLELQCFWKEVHTLPPLTWVHRACLLRSSGCRNVRDCGLLKMP